MRIPSSPLASVEPASPRAVRCVAASATPASMTEIRGALGRAHVALTGRPATPALLDTLAAQVSVETAGGQKMFNHNFGGIKGAGPQGESAHYMTREVEGGRSVHSVQGFRSYRSLDEGAIDYVATLQGRYGAALGHAERGDVDGFAPALKTNGYFTAPENEYVSALRSRMASGGDAAGARLASNALGPVYKDGMGYPPAGGDLGISMTDALGRFVDNLSSAHIAAPPSEDD